MFKLLVSKTLVNLSIAALLFGPGISVFTTGACGSSGKKFALLFEVEVGATAATVAYCLVRNSSLNWRNAGRVRLADLSRETMAVLEMMC